MKAELVGSVFRKPPAKNSNYVDHSGANRRSFFAQNGPAVDIDSQVSRKYHVASGVEKHDDLA